jgi:hypothetical protein
VAWGRESDAFYAAWARDDDLDVVGELKGPVLNLASRQSRHADAILRMTEQTVLRDPASVARLKRHYALFRPRIDGGEPRREDAADDGA